MFTDGIFRAVLLCAVAFVCDVACYHLIQAWLARVPGLSGKRKLVFDRSESCGKELWIPCGQCVGCRLEHSRQWAVRMMHEASLHADNCFITLTYAPENLPPDGSLVKSDFQKFMKRLRRRFFSGIKFFHCGEYGENFGRPHYHACLFGFDFPDRVFFKMAGESRLYTSDILDDVWSLGHCSIGDVTFESAAYVARYVMKKVTGDSAKDHYLVVDRETGVIAQDSSGALSVLQPEYVTMSRGGRTGKGLAYEWYRQFGNEVYPSDEVIVRGARSKPPRYYDGMYEVADPVGFSVMKSKRLAAAHEAAADNTEARLRTREKCCKARVSLLKRGMENDS